jgi:hypothetical protein
MPRESIASIMGVEPETNDDVAVIVSALTGERIELCLSARKNGEMSVTLDIEKARQLAESLKKAINHASIRAEADSPPATES